MLESIKKMLGFGPSVDLGEVLRNGAVIVDVRTKGEYNSGHVKGSVNIPLDNLQQHIEKLRKQNKTVITCCASGMRSRAAAGMLKSNGITAYNGGSWYSVDALKSRNA